MQKQTAGGKYKGKEKEVKEEGIKCGKPGHCKKDCRSKMHTDGRTLSLLEETQTEELGSLEETTASTRQLSGWLSLAALSVAGTGVWPTGWNSDYPTLQNISPIRLLPAADNCEPLQSQGTKNLVANKNGEKYR
eukprot:2791785-Amphidinium_carterae.1